MSYEIYVDKLFVINFCMNLYIMILVNGATYRTATRRRLLLGAFMGAGCNLLPFVMRGNLIVKLLLGYGVGTLVMLHIGFSISKWNVFIQLFQKLLLYTFLLGGMMLCVLKIPLTQKLGLTTTWGMVGMGAVMTLLLGKIRNKPSEISCNVVLVHEQDRIRASAIVDSGNSLVEPISGSPVSLIDREVFENFYRGEELRYRVIPYTSVGKRRGILHGYLIPELQIEVNGMMKRCTNVYVALRGQEQEDSVKFILHPQLLEYPCKRSKKNDKRGWNYDIKGCNTGENAY